MGHLPVYGVVFGVAVAGNHAYVVVGGITADIADFKAVDISDPTSPMLVGEALTTGFPIGVVVVGSYAYVADILQGPRRGHFEPRLTCDRGERRTPDYTQGVAAVGDRVYVAGGTAGLVIYPSQCDATAGVVDKALPSSISKVVSPYPNPFGAYAIIRYDLPRRATVDLDIYEPTGRLVRVLEGATAKEAGVHRALWDGRNAHDLRLPAGVYFYRLKAGGHNALTGRVVLME